MRREGVLVFASGSEEEAEGAVGIMNRLGAMKVEELAGSAAITGLRPDGAVSGFRERPIQAERILGFRDGARVFVWVSV